MKSARYRIYRINGDKSRVINSPLTPAFPSNHPNPSVNVHGFRITQPWPDDVRQSRRLTAGPVIIVRRSTPHGLVDRNVLHP